MPARTRLLDRVQCCESVSGVIKAADWMAALDRVEEPSPDAMSIRQWCERIGRHKDYTAAWIRSGLENGWMERANITIGLLTGGVRRGVGFRLTKKSKK